MSYKGVKLNPFEVLITGWRCFVWFLKPLQYTFVFEAVNVYRKNRRAMWAFATWQHILSVNQTFFNPSLIQKQKKGKKLNTQTFTTWQFSLQTQYNYTHIIPVWLCFFKLKRIQRQAQVKTNHPFPPPAPPSPPIHTFLSTKPLTNQHHQFLFAFVDLF